MLTIGFKYKLAHAILELVHISSWLILPLQLLGRVDSFLQSYMPHAHLSHHHMMSQLVTMQHMTHTVPHENKYLTQLQYSINYYIACVHRRLCP